MPRGVLWGSVGEDPQLDVASARQQMTAAVRIMMLFQSDQRERPERSARRPEVFAEDESTGASLVGPGVQASDTERFEMSGVAGYDDLSGTLGDGRDQRIIVGSVFGHAVDGQDASSGQVER